MQVGDIITSIGYPDFKIIAIVDNAIALERTDGILEPLLWYSKPYIKRMLDNAWKIK